jgi:PAS domain S-box-containing protein
MANLNRPADSIRRSPSKRDPDPERNADILQIFENTGDGAWAVDADQRIILWNKAAEEMLGYTAEEAIGQCCHELLRGRDAGSRLVCRAHCAISEQARRNRPINSFQLRVRHGDGQVAWIDVSNIVIPDEAAAGEYAALVHLFRLIDDAGKSTPPLRIYLLGPVIVRRADGSVVSHGFQRRAKVRALFAILVLHRGQAVRRDVLLSLLWPKMPRRAALHNLNTTVYYLRHSLEPGLELGADSAYIQRRGGRYVLVAGRAHWLDVDAFENKLAVARRVEDPERSEELYREAIALYRGPFLADLDVDQLDCWAERERYRQLYLTAYQRLADLFLSQDRDDEANDLCRKILAQDPCREATTRKLMRLALRQGERTRALSHYAKLEENLERELGVEPSQETRRLRQEAQSKE